VFFLAKPLIITLLSLLYRFYYTTDEPFVNNLNNSL